MCLKYTNHNYHHTTENVRNKIKVFYIIMVSQKVQIMLFYNSLEKIKRNSSADGINEQNRNICGKMTWHRPHLLGHEGDGVLGLDGFGRAQHHRGEHHRQRVGRHLVAVRVHGNTAWGGDDKNIEI